VSAFAVITSNLGANWPSADRPYWTTCMGAFASVRVLAAFRPNAVGPRRVVRDFCLTSVVAGPFCCRTVQLCASDRTCYVTCKAKARNKTASYHDVNRRMPRGSAGDEFDAFAI
jgi:hypothetical protein